MTDQRISNVKYKNTKKKKLMQALDRMSAQKGNVRICLYDVKF